MTNTTTTKHVKAPINPIAPRLQNLFSGLSGSDASPFDNIAEEDHSFLINTLYYTDSVSGDKTHDHFNSPFIDAMKRNTWV